MDTLKSLNEICEPDSRQKLFVIYDPVIGDYRPRTLNDHYLDIRDIVLADKVPERVREHFETARNLLLYSWYVYRFIPVSELHAFSSVELALRVKSGKKRAMLKELLNSAIKNGWIEDNGFRIHRALERTQNKEPNAVEEKPLTQPDDPDTQSLRAYCQILAESLPYLRNELAHGAPMLYPGGYSTLAICADLINQLFEGKPEDKR